MHAVAEDRLAPERVRVMARQHSGGRWQALDGGNHSRDEGTVIPRQAPRHEAARGRWPRRVLPVLQFGRSAKGTAVWPGKRWSGEA